MVEGDLNSELQSERRATPTPALKAAMVYYNKGLSCWDKLSYNNQNVLKYTQGIVGRLLQQQRTGWPG